jgi:hypothetical protein
MKKISFLICMITLLAGLFLSACTGGRIYECNTNEEISQEVSEQVHQLHEMFIDALQRGDKDTLKNMLASAAETMSAEEVESTLDESIRLSERPAVTYNEHYLRIFNTDKEIETIIPSLSADNEYTFIVSPLSKEMYVIFSTIDYPEITYMLSTVYVFKENLWEIQRYAYSPYRYGGMNAAELTQKAGEFLDEGEYLQARLYVTAAYQAIRPAGTMLYPNEREISNQINEIAAATSDLFKELPVITYEGREISIIGFDVMNTEQEGLFPVAVCVSETLDEEALKKEASVIAENLHTHYGKSIESFQYVLVRSYLEEPSDPNKVYQHYTTVVEVESIL